MNNGILRITTKLIKKEFTKGIKEMQGEAELVTKELQASGEGGEALASSLGMSTASMIGLAAAAAALIVAIALVVKSTQRLLETNEELQQKVDGIGQAFTNLWNGVLDAIGQQLKPIIESILYSLYKILVYINAITQAFFGFTLFTENADDNINKTNKDAKKLKKTLAGFDEMNVLSDNSSSSATSTLSNEVKSLKELFGEIELPSWLETLTSDKSVKNITDIWQKTEWIRLLATAIFNPWSLLAKVWKEAPGQVTAIYTAFNVVKNKIINVVTALWKAVSTFFSNLGTKVGDTFKAAFKTVFNGLMATLEGKLNTVIATINTILSTANKLTNGKIGKLSTVKLPRLARGGIVNNPGSGVVMGSYVAGEKGAEAVLPLTDDTLQRLANMIPITIDLTNTIDGSVLNRRLETIRKNNSFILNN